MINDIVQVIAISKDGDVTIQTEIGLRKLSIDYFPFGIIIGSILFLNSETQKFEILKKQ